MKNIVYMLEHIVVHDYENDREDVKVIGVYSSLDEVHNAIARLKKKPGFSKFPNMIDETPDESNTGGFICDQYTINKDSWQDGFGGCLK